MLLADYSLVRKIVELSGLYWTAASPFGNGRLGEAPLAPTRLYVRACLVALKVFGVHAFVHISRGYFN